MKRAADATIDINDDIGKPSEAKKPKLDQEGASPPLALAPNPKRVLFLYAPTDPDEHCGWIGEFDLSEPGATEFWAELQHAWNLCEEGQTDPEQSANAERAGLLDYLAKQWHPEKDDEDGENTLKRRRPELLSDCPALLRILKQTPRAAGTWKAFDTLEGPQSLVLNGPWDAVFIFAESSGKMEQPILPFDKIHKNQHAHCAHKDESDAESEHSFEEDDNHVLLLEPGLPFPSATDLGRAPRFSS